MKEVTKITQGDWTLEHRRYVDDFGFLRDAFEMIWRRESGGTIHYPFLAPLKVKNYLTEENIMDMTSDFTDQEYLDIFREMQTKFATSHPPKR